jgi:hypothetical protein
MNNPSKKIVNEEARPPPERVMTRKNRRKKNAYTYERRVASHCINEYCQ